MIPNNRVYIIGETAFHHEGDVDFLIGLVKAAQDLELDAIKFHLTVDVDDYMVHNHEALDILRPWCLGESDWDKVFKETGDLDLILLCNDVASMEYAKSKDLNIRALEIHASGLNDVFLLDSASTFKGTVMLGTGGSTLDEIDFAINYLNARGQNDIFLMHGFQNYPTDPKDIKLDRMIKLSELFNLPMGYADHTDPADANNEYISCLGIAKGFSVIEKHFTTAFGEQRIDAQAAVSIEQMKKIKALATITKDAMGTEKPLQLTTAELKYGNTGPMKKALVAREDITKATQIALEHIAFKRTNESSSIKQNEINKILNNTAVKDIKKDEIIDLSNVEYAYVAQDINQFKNTSKK